MDGFFKSFRPLARQLHKPWRKYRAEIILLTAALMIAVISLIIFSAAGESRLAPTTENGEIDIVTDETRPAPPATKILVDVAGSVVKPDVYQVAPGSRLKDVIALAKGLNDEADRDFFKRNFNLARLVSDQEKIYVPSSAEIENGVFAENKLILDYTQPSVSSAINMLQPVSAGTGGKISVNGGTLEELDQLPGVGSVTAQKIISGRPYNSIDELLSKKSVGKSVFEKIKSMIEL